VTNVGQAERVTQNRLVQLFQQQLGYTYYGNWQDRPDNTNIEADYCRDWLIKQGTSEAMANKAIRALQRAAAMGDGKKLYKANEEVYSLLRYGVHIRPSQGEQTQTVRLIDWQNPENNDFAIAEEVTVKGKHNKRPDIVLYVNGIALGVLELKRSLVSIGEGIRQNLDNQSAAFIPQFFSTMQLVMAGSDSEGLRYGTIETKERHYYRWAEENPNYDASRDDRSQRYLSVHNINAANTVSGSGLPQLGLLDFDILNLCNKKRLLDIVHNFMVFDAGTKKTCRKNQYFGVHAAQQRIQQGSSSADQGGIIWHTQGSGKSLTMVWLAKWIREYDPNARVLVITDRTELDEQIEGVFHGVGEAIYRSKSSADLVAELNKTDEWLLCSLVHKFGRQGEGDSDEGEQATDDYLAALKRSLTSDFVAKGNIFVFVDECHRTQSGKLHTAMQAILPEAVFIGFTGTPLMKKDKQKSIEVFGSFIHTYKFDEAVADGVVLDLQYEARDINQYISSQKGIDDWFESKTRNLSNMAKVQLKQKWGTLKKVLSSRSRLDQIVQDILMDMENRPRLIDGSGNAMLVCASIYQACKVFEIFSKTELKGHCAIVTSYLPSVADIKGEQSGEGLTEKLHQYEIYQQMLADYFELPKDDAIKKAELFEQKVKQQFKDEPGQMRLLIVVDKLLTGFDAPSATYLYIDKTMRDHGLFQAICRVNRLDGDKNYGYIIDYKDLFHSLESSITDYTSGAFDQYDKEDVAGLLTDRLDKSRATLEEAREATIALCEPVTEPKEEINYIHYFCGDVANPEDLLINEPKRVALYKNAAALLRAYVDLANEMQAAGYSAAQAQKIKAEVEEFTKMRQVIMRASKDAVDLKHLEPAMRRLIDQYIRAEDSEKLVDFEDLGLVELIVEKAKQNPVEPTSSNVPEARAEPIENNIRKVIIDEQPINPRYYEKMSELLEALIAQRRAEAISYQEYLAQVKKLAADIAKPQGSVRYPSSVDTQGKQSIYDNFGQNETLVTEIDDAVHRSRKNGWKSNPLKTRKVKYAVEELAAVYNVNVDAVMDLIKQQPEYD